jgi:hypothetical protein
VIPGSTISTGTDVMAKYPQWDGKVYRAAKPGEGFRWDTADGAQRRAQIERQRRSYAQRRLDDKRESAGDADELDRLQWAGTPWPARVIVCIVEGLLWPFKALA